MIWQSRLQSVVFLLALISMFTGAAWAAPAPVAAGDAAATVVALRGEAVAVDAAGGERQLAIESPVYVDDTIRTGPRGRLQLMFPDNTIIGLGTNGELEVADYRWDGEDGSLNTRVNRGAFRVMGGSVARTAPESFTTETPAATIGIRGSMYAGRVRDGALAVVFQGGTGIIVANPAGTVEITTPGMGTRVSSTDEAPAAPEEFSREELEALEDEDEALEGETAEKESVEEEWDDAALDESAGSEDPGVAGPPLAATEDQVSDTTSEAAQEELSGDVVGEAGYSGQKVLFWSDGETPGSFEHTALASAPAELAAMEDQFLEEYGEFSDGPYNDVWYVDNIEENWTEENWEESYFLEEFALVDNRGEFWIYDRWYYSEEKWEERVLFHGQETPAELMPASGGTRFSGFFAGGSDSEPEGLFYGNMELAVNWETGKAVGYFDDGYQEISAPVFMTAEVEGNSLTNINFLGLDYLEYQDYDGTGDGSAAYITGNAEFSRFYGGEHQGLGLAAQGEAVSMTDGTVVDEWSLLSAGFRDPEFIIDYPAETVQWQGFVTALGVNPGGGEHPALLRNSSPDDFQMTIDRGSGEFTATIAATLVDDETGGVADLTAEGWYLADQYLAGRVVGTTDSIYAGQQTTGINPEGNFLVGSGGGFHDGAEEFYGAQKLAEHLSWGYWSVNFSNPDTGNLEVFDPRGTFWVAGTPTDPGQIQDLIVNSAVGTYQGGAQGVMVDHATGLVGDLYGGTTDLTIYFGSGEVEGTINFPDQVELGVGGGTVTADGFAAAITPTGGGFGELDGAFYGPDATSVGGNFHAEDEINKYLGVFGADQRGLVNEALQ